MLVQILNIVTTAAILYVVATGLFVIFGVMNVINFAHGAFLLVGAYTALAVSNLGWSPWTTFLVAPLTGAVLGAAVEMLVVRRLYARPLDTILATWGLSIVVTQGVMLAYGRGVQYVDTPLAGVASIGDTAYAKYRLFVLGLAVLLGLGLLLVTRATQLGLIARAVIMNEELAKALGISIRKVQLSTFAVGAALASFAGAVLAPIISIDPSLGIPWLVSAFMVVLVAGVSLWGLGASALLLGGSQALAAYYISPVVGSLAVVLLAAVLLRVLPLGLGTLSIEGVRSRRTRRPTA